MGGQMGQDRLERNFRTGWGKSQVGPVRVWIGFEQDWLQAPQSQVGPVRVWISFEQDWLQAPQGQVGPVKVWMAVGSETHTACPFFLKHPPTRKKKKKKSLENDPGQLRLG